MDSGQPSTIFALTAFDGVYASNDGGQSWTAKSVGLPVGGAVLWSHLFGNQMGQSPSDPRTLFAVQNGRVYRSEDGADSWMLAHAGISTCGVDSIAGVAVSPYDPSHVIAGTIISNCDEPTLFESRDGGRQWSAINAAGIGNDSWMAAFDPFQPERLYLATIYRGFHFSPDGGQTFTQSNPLNALASEISFVAPSLIDQGRLLLGGRAGLFASDDFGVSWSSALVGGTVSGASFGLTQPNTGYAAGDVLHRTEDGGRSWTQVSEEGGDVVVRHPQDPNAFYLGSSSGFVRGQMVGDQALLEPAENGLPMNIQVRAVSRVKRRSYATVASEGFFRQYGDGRWRRASSGNPEISRSIFVAAAPRAPRIVYAGVQVLHRSRNGGRSFKALDLPIDLRTEIFNAAAVHPKNPRLVFVGTSSGRLFRSENGVDFLEVSSFLSSRQVNEIVFDPTDSARVYAATYDNVWVSDDTGESWRRLTDASGDHANVDSLVIDPREPTTLYISTRGERVFRSRDRGLSWEETLDISPEPRVVLRVDREGGVYVFGARKWWAMSRGENVWLEGPENGLGQFDTFVPSTMHLIARGRHRVEIRGAVNARGLYALRTSRAFNRVP